MYMLEKRLIMDKKTNSNGKEKKECIYHYNRNSPFPSFR